MTGAGGRELAQPGSQGQPRGGGEHPSPAGETGISH